MRMCKTCTRRPTPRCACVRHTVALFTAAMPWPHAGPVTLPGVRVRSYPQAVGKRSYPLLADLPRDLRGVLKPSQQAVGLGRGGVGIGVGGAGWVGVVGQLLGEGWLHPTRFHGCCGVRSWLAIHCRFGRSASATGQGASRCNEDAAPGWQGVNGEPVHTPIRHGPGIPLYVLHSAARWVPPTSATSSSTRCSTKQTASCATGACVCVCGRTERGTCVCEGAKGRGRQGAVCVWGPGMFINTHGREGADACAFPHGCTRACAPAA
jgi:hypothetical protein